LDKSGFKVYAGVCKLADGDNLKNEVSEHKKPTLHFLATAQIKIFCHFG